MKIKLDPLSVLCNNSTTLLTEWGGSSGLEIKEELALAPNRILDIMSK